MKCERATEAGR